MAKVVKAPSPEKAARPQVVDTRDEEYYRMKSSIYNALIETIDLSQLAQLDQKTAREEIRDIVNEIIAIKQVVMSINEQEQLLGDIINDVPVSYTHLDVYKRQELSALQALLLQQIQQHQHQKANIKRQLVMFYNRFWDNENEKINKYLLHLRPNIIRCLCIKR